MDTQQALLAEVIANPDDDLPRLVMADWLDETQEPEKVAVAEFIRLSVEIEKRGGYYGACKEPHQNAIVGCGSCEACEITRRMDVLIEDGDPHNITGGWQIADQWAWSYRSYDHAAPCPEAVIRRGFVDEVRCTLVDWIGSECERCGGDGRVTAPNPQFTRNCPVCGGDPYRLGIGPAVVKAHPVTKVVLTDAVQPREYGGGDDRWAIYREHLGPLWRLVLLDPNPDAFPFAEHHDREFLTRTVGLAAIKWSKLKAESGQT